LIGMYLVSFTNKKLF